MSLAFFLPSSLSKLYKDYSTRDRVHKMLAIAISH